MKPRFLIIRFSSIGDILQALTAAQAFKSHFPEAEIHWVVKNEFAELVRACPYVDHIWKFDKKLGFRGLIDLSRKLSALSWSHIYDAHNNLRSHILTRFLKSEHFVRRSKNRWKRFLEFHLALRQFKQPFIGQESFLLPLKKWGLSGAIPLAFPLKIERNEALLRTWGLNKPYVAFMPSAAWVMKRWPIAHWRDLISRMSSVPKDVTTKAQILPIVLLGGKEDLFIDDLKGPNVVSLAGKLSLLESLQIVSGAQALVSGDTGLLHAADQMGIPAIALIGPTAFGYPAHKQVQVAEVFLPCKPCSKDGRGKCKNSVYQKCMLDITPEKVEKMLRKIVSP